MAMLSGSVPFVPSARTSKLHPKRAVNVECRHPVFVVTVELVLLSFRPLGVRSRLVGERHWWLPYGWPNDALDT